MLRIFSSRSASSARVSVRRQLAVSSFSTQSSSPLTMGCVSYDPSVGEIWSGIQDYLVEECKVPFRYQLFDSYEEQVASLSSSNIDVAWNGPVAHVMTELAANKANKEAVSLGMRDVDQDFESILIVRKDANIQSMEDLQNRHLLLGTKDSPQACIVPYYFLTQELGIEFAKVTQFDVDVGKHGDTAIGEIQVMEALISGATSAADLPPQVATVSRMMWDRGLAGALAPQIDPDKLKDTCMELTSVSLPKFDHCQFDAILAKEDYDDKKAKLNDFGKAILAMDWNNPKHQYLMKLEGIQKEWKPPRQGGYDIVRKAMIGSDAIAKHHQATNFSYQKRSFSTAIGSSKPQKICVIGAGVSGLQALRALKAKGFDVKAYDSSPNVGGLWQSNYSNFGVQVPKQLYEFQDFPMTQVQWGEYASGPQVQEYIESYAKAFGLNDSIQCNTKVVGAMQQSNDGKKWKITSEAASDGSSQTEDFDYLVVATGLYSNGKTFIPTKPGQETFQGDIIHSSRFTDATAAQDKNVVIIGSGKSAVDCAVEATKAGAESVTLLQRTAHWPTPQMIAGVIPFQYIFLSRLGTALVSTHRGTYPGSGMPVNAFRNSVIGPMLMKPVFRIVEELFAFQFGLRGDLRPKSDVVTDFYNVALVLNSELKQLRNEGKLNVQMGEIDSYGDDGKSVSLKDGSSLPADMVISATGFEQDYSIFDEATKKGLDVQKDGTYLYRYILPEKVPNLAFIGNVGAISNISSYGLQSEWLARLLSGDLQDNGAASDPAQMSAEIEARKAWARSWIPESSYRGNLVLLHQTHYHDQLCKDMGLNPHRKSNPIAEYLMPYEPADYDGIMGGKMQVEN